VATEGLAEEDAPHRIVTDGYFRTLGIPLAAGRAFTPADRAGAQPVVMVNRSFEQRYFPSGGAVGRRMAFDPEGPWHEIVGVVGDTRHLGLEEPPVPAVYAPHRQKTWEWMSWMTLLVRVDPLGGEGADPVILADAVRAEVWALDGALPLLAVRTVEEIYADSLARRRFDTLLVSLFAAAALALGLVGLYGVMAFSVARRTREIGVRMALGARGGSVTGMVLAEGARLTAAGLIVGLAGALAATRLLSSLLFGIEPHDPATFAAVAALLVALALTACWLPARRAARIDPARALQ
jgi:predicted permease